MTRIGRASLVWTRPALDSLLDITRYIQADKPSAAPRFAASIKSKVGRLQTFPQSGRVVPEFPSGGLREVIVADYRVIYRFMKSQNTVQILAVQHGARLLDVTQTEDWLNEPWIAARAKKAAAVKAQFETAKKLIDEWPIESAYVDYLARGGIGGEALPAKLKRKRAARPDIRKDAEKLLKRLR